MPERGRRKPAPLGHAAARIACACFLSAAVLFSCSGLLLAQPAMTAPVGVASPLRAPHAPRVVHWHRPRTDLQALHSPVRPVLGAALTASTTASDPVSIRIPVLGVNQRLVQLGVVGDSLQVPDRYSDVGWWSGGPAPGEKGAAVMVGHVDSLTGPAVFYQLSGLRPGDQIIVGRGNGSRLVFGVRQVTEFAKSHFPSARIYRTDGPPALHLLTCGGSFDRQSGHYTGNVVVFAPLLRRLPAPTQHRNGIPRHQPPGSGHIRTQSHLASERKPW